MNNGSQIRWILTASLNRSSKSSVAIWLGRLFQSVMVLGQKLYCTLHYTMIGMNLNECSVGGRFEGRLASVEQMLGWLLPLDHVGMHSLAACHLC